MIPTRIRHQFYSWTPKTTCKGLPRRHIHARSWKTLLLVIVVIATYVNLKQLQLLNVKGKDDAPGSRSLSAAQRGALSAVQAAGVVQTDKLHAAATQAIMQIYVPSRRAASSSAYGINETTVSVVDPRGGDSYGPSFDKEIAGSVTAMRPYDEAACHVQPHTEYSGAAVLWGTGNHQVP